MISIEERKLALFIQTNLLRMALDNLKQDKSDESELHTGTGRKAYSGFMDQVAGLDLNSKGK